MIILLIQRQLHIFLEMIIYNFSSVHVLDNESGEENLSLRICSAKPQRLFQMSFLYTECTFLIIQN